MQEVNGVRPAKVDALGSSNLERSEASQRSTSQRQRTGGYFAPHFTFGSEPEDEDEGSQGGEREEDLHPRRALLSPLRLTTPLTRASVDIHSASQVG